MAVLRGVWHYVPVNLRPRLLLAVVAALIFSPMISATEVMPFVIRFGQETGIDRTEAARPPIFFAVPKYSLSTTERDTIAACLVLEAANQGDFGMRSVMAVIRNRARGMPELFSVTVLREKQFSALNKLTAGRETRNGMIARARRDPMWSTALTIVDDAMHDTWQDPTEGATHYTRTGERTRWTHRLAKTVTIGAHSFYR
jgi:spore germination cell wall hydrolase CwlJ-like protein